MYFEILIANEISVKFPWLFPGRNKLDNINLIIILTKSKQ